ncbi:Uracil-DNA glycosylase [Pichia kudriavzevii]|uniref:Uracil-DNA glycosylase n=1 Tax=Pichia kudriavzevii TaxID=4909 RepID=A0A1V2LKG0_PICKU|nr:Uracil-DNA glycosylase [Pichia kudriavzevii]
MTKREITDYFPSRKKAKSLSSETTPNSTPPSTSTTPNSIPSTSTTPNSIPSTSTTPNSIPSTSTTPNSIPSTSTTPNSIPSTSTKPNNKQPQPQPATPPPALELPHLSSPFKEEFVKTLTEHQKRLLQLEIDTIEPEWFKVLAERGLFTSESFLSLKEFLLGEIQRGKEIYPSSNDVYAWSRATPLKMVRVVIIGQDPYHNKGQAHGLAFSVKDVNAKKPPSLANIFRGIHTDFPQLAKKGLPKHCDLSAWTHRGVLLLNSVLTVEAHRANSHAKRGWEEFTSGVLEALLEFGPAHIVVMAWGKSAERTVRAVVARGRHLLLYGVHPSPLSAHRGFFSQGHFSKCVEWLRVHGYEDIDESFWEI